MIECLSCGSVAQGQSGLVSTGQVVGSIPVFNICMAEVYILQSERNNRYYVGSTKNLDRRLKEHKNGKSKFTKLVLPIKLVFRQKFNDIRIARKVEYWLKRQKDKKLLERVIIEGRIMKEF